MSSACLANPVRYKDQLKLMRAETVVSWFTVAFDRAVDMLKIEPEVIAASDETPKRWYGAFY